MRKEHYFADGRQVYASELKDIINQCKTVKIELRWGEGENIVPLNIDVEVLPQAITVKPIHPASIEISGDNISLKIYDIVKIREPEKDTYVVTCVIWEPLSMYMEYVFHCQQ